MKVHYINHKAPVLVGDYPYADSVNQEILSLLEQGVYTPIGSTNVKASIHTEWDWEPHNIKFRNLKAYIREEIEKAFRPGALSDGNRIPLRCDNFWANVYERGDYAEPHEHRPFDYSFAYYVKTKWYHSSLVFTDSGKKIRPKEGRFVAFPAYLKHHVCKHRYNDTRITLSGNLLFNNKPVFVRQSLNK